MSDKLPKHDNDLVAVAPSISDDGAWIQYDIRVRNGGKLEFLVPFFRLGRLFAQFREQASTMKQRLEKNPDAAVDSDVAAALEAPTIRAITPVVVNDEVLLTIDAVDFPPITYATDRKRLADVLLQIVQNSGPKN